MQYHADHVRLCPTTPPVQDAAQPVMLTEHTMVQRLEKVLWRMKQAGLKTLIVYGDVEHSGNFEYLTGFMTRFEEGLLVLHDDGEAALLVGNENVKLGTHSRIPARVLHCPMLSLPNQPMAGEKPLEMLLQEAGVRHGMRTGLAGWKLFTAADGRNAKRFDVPSFITDAIRDVVGSEYVQNATAIFIGPDGARRVNNANEIAHYEYGSALASDGMLRAMESIRPGISELELGGLLNSHGQRCSVVTICAAGARYAKGNLYPTARPVKTGDAVSMTCGYRGGLASRAAYAVQDVSELPQGCQDYVQVLSAPYFAAITAWLECIHPGMTGGEMHALIEKVLPRATYHWSLCPGHLTAEEEWLCSPIYEGSAERLESGMLLQLDIIPSQSGYAGTGCENGIALADAELREQIRREYPEMWQRMCRRRDYIMTQLGICLPECVLPLCSGVAYMRPYLLNKHSAFRYCHDTCEGEKE